MASDTTTEVMEAASEMASEVAGEMAAEAPGMPQLDFTTYANQITWLLVAMVLIYLILSKVALPRIATVLSERQNAISSDLEQAEALKEKAVEAEESYNAALTAARAEAGVIVAEAKAEIQKDLDAAIAVADAEIAAKTAESEGRIGEIRASAVKSVQQVANDTAGEIVQAIMPGLGDAKAVTAAVKAKMKGVEA